MGPKYLKHLTGMTMLLGWLARWERLGQSLRFKGPVLRLSDLASQRIGLGWPARPTPRAAPFLAFQKEERAWAEHISWERAVLATDEQRIFLIGRPERAHEGDAVDVPAFALGIALDHPSKAALLGSCAALEGRSMFEDPDAGGWVVARGVILWRLKLEVVPTISQVLRPDDLSADRSFLDMVADRISRTNRYTEPKFQGERPVVSDEFKDLVEPFDINKMVKLQ